jgi:hypothetical protein
MAAANRRVRGKRITATFSLVFRNQDGISREPDSPGLDFLTPISGPMEYHRHGRIVTIAGVPPEFLMDALMDAPMDTM